MFDFIKIEKKKKEQKCGVKCWYAKGDECNCICNGKNHGKYNKKDYSIFLEEYEENDTISK